ncbi:TIGR00725 family protein [Sporichthya polymorpha]|uniref:TIGR00725 family protein n=1 Tax=Sporichthya polymorpha TaxID=35751 RepID=UPI00036B60DD|nr:TIGR00725 family protein [Sporichthya polymorpha]
MTEQSSRAAAARRQIAVVGPEEADERELQLARGVGRLLAVGGAVVVTGGLGGVMHGACEGAHLGEGLTLGLLPGTDRRTANPFVDVAVATGLGQGRNLLVVQTADAVVAIGRSPGTLSEIALAVRLGKPVVLLASYPHEDLLPGCVPAGSPKEAAEEALRLAAGGV